MSKTKLPYEHAMEVAQRFIEEFSPYCQRMETAGSLRRKKAEVGDIEIVCIPQMTTANDLFGDPVPVSMVDIYTANDFTRLEKNGPHYKQIIYGPVCVDLFITTPEQWGVNFTIRTGSADFSHWLVTTKQKGGALPSFMKVHDARIWAGNKPYDTREEKDVFKVIGLEYIEPEERIDGRWHR